jgi:5-formyltetrahydrofolate cyclo-ligase
MSATPLSGKPDLRKTMLALREQIPVDARIVHNAAITARILKLPEYQQARTILGYMNFGSEFASELWLIQALADGKKLALPKVNLDTKQLDLYWVDDLEKQLLAGPWGIREPMAERCQRLNSLNEVEFALLPGVAFSRNGARLGYGGGFYDKLLAVMTHRPVLAAAAFTLQLIEQIPQDETDVKVEWLITEQEVIACSARE